MAGLHPFTKQSQICWSSVCIWPSVCLCCCLCLSVSVCLRQSLSLGMSFLVLSPPSLSLSLSLSRFRSISLAPVLSSYLSRPLSSSRPLSHFHSLFRHSSCFRSISLALVFAITLCPFRSTSLALGIYLSVSLSIAHYHFPFYSRHHSRCPLAIAVARSLTFPISLSLSLLSLCESSILNVSISLIFYSIDCGCRRPLRRYSTPTLKYITLNSCDFGVNAKQLMHHLTPLFASHCYFQQSWFLHNKTTETCCR